MHVVEGVRGVVGSVGLALTWLGASASMCLASSYCLESICLGQPIKIIAELAWSDVPFGHPAKLGPAPCKPDSSYVFGGLRVTDRKTLMVSGAVRPNLAEDRPEWVVARVYLKESFPSGLDRKQICDRYLRLFPPDDHPDEQQQAKDCAKADQHHRDGSITHYGGPVYFTGGGSVRVDISWRVHDKDYEVTLRHHDAWSEMPYPKKVAAIKQLKACRQ